MYRIKITAKGQITLPKMLRENIGLKEGDYLEASTQNDSILLKPVQEKSRRDAILEYCRSEFQGGGDLEAARKILSGLPFSLADRVTKLREEE